MYHGERAFIPLASTKSTFCVRLIRWNTKKNDNSVSTDTITKKTVLLARSPSGPPHATIIMEAMIEKMSGAPSPHKPPNAECLILYLLSISHPVKLCNIIIANTGAYFNHFGKKVHFFTCFAPFPCAILEILAVGKSLQRLELT